MSLHSLVMSAASTPLETSYRWKIPTWLTEKHIISGLLGSASWRDDSYGMCLKAKTSKVVLMVMSSHVDKNQYGPRPFILGAWMVGTFSCVLAIFMGRKVKAVARGDFIHGNALSRCEHQQDLLGQAGMCRTRNYAHFSSKSQVGIFIGTRFSRVPMPRWHD